MTSEKIQKILKAANVEVESYWPGLFAQMIKDKGMAALLTGGIITAFYIYPSVFDFVMILLCQQPQKVEEEVAL